MFSSPRVGVASLMLVGALVVTAAPSALLPGVAGAATKTTKASKSSKGTDSGKGKGTGSSSKQAVPVKVTAGTVLPTTLPKPRRAGTPITGWAKISSSEWPDPGNAVSVHPVGSSLLVYVGPDDSTAPLRFDEGKSVFGRVSLLVVGSAPGWWKVLLPLRPNGTVGWVRTDAVERTDVAQRLVLELDTNTLTFYSAGKVVVRTQVAAGTGGTPTPTGLFYVKEIVPQKNKAGALGPVALGLSGFSTVLYSFAGGDGVIGIHGTSAPGKLGQNVSHGCVRVLNEHISLIASKVVLGTPVEIVQTAADIPVTRFLVPAESDLTGPTTTSTSIPEPSPSGPTTGPRNSGPTTLSPTTLSPTTSSMPAT